MNYRLMKTLLLLCLGIVSPYCMGHAEIRQDCPPAPYDSAYINLYSFIENPSDSVVAQVQDILEQLAPDDKNARPFFQYLLFSYYCSGGEYQAADSLAEIVYKNFGKLPNSYMQAQTDLNYAVSLDARQLYSKSVPYLSRAYDWSESVKDGEMASNALAELAFSYLFQEKFDSTIYYNDKAYLAAEMRKDTALMVNALNKAGVAYKRQFAFNRSIQEYKKAYELNEIFGNKGGECLVILNNIASLYVELHEAENAVDFGRMMFRYLVNEDRFAVRNAACYNTMAALLNDAQLPQNALDTINIGLRYIDEFATIPDGLKMVMYYNKANSFVKLADGQPNDSAMYCLRKAESFVPTSRNMRDVANFYYLYGSMMYQRHNYPAARLQLEKAVEIYRSNNSSVAVEAMKMLAQVEYVGFGNFHRSAQIYKEMADLVMQINREEYAHRTAGFEVEFDTKQKELEIAQLKQQELINSLAAERRTFWLLFVLSVLVLVIAFLIFYMRQRKIRHQLAQDQLRHELEIKIHNMNEEISRLTQAQNDRYIEGLEQENEILARELHDGICNQLFTLELSLKDEISAEKLSRISATREEVRTLSHNLSMPAFAEVPLYEVVSQYLARLSDLNVVEVNSFIEDSFRDRKISGKIQREIYRVIQEFINNMLKYAKAGNFHLTLTCDEANLLDLVLEDDGVGFDIARVKKGLGLNVIEKRVKSINGSVEIESEPERGTLLHLTVKI